MAAARSADRGRETRQRLLDATVPLIGEVGWNSVTTRLVAERAGVNQALVHYHFSSVSALLVAACVEFTRGMLDQMVRTLTAHSTVAEGIDWLLNELTRYTPEDPTFSTIAEAFLNAGRLPALRTELAAILADFRGGVAAWLRERGERGDADAVAALLAASIDGLLLHRAVDPGLDITAAAAPLRRLASPTPTRQSQPNSTEEESPCEP